MEELEVKQSNSPPNEENKNPEKEMTLLELQRARKQ